MKLVKTVKCKLEIDEQQKQAIHDTVAKFTQACNDALAVARKKKLWNAYKLQRLCYHQLKERDSSELSVGMKFAIGFMTRVSPQRIKIAYAYTTPWNSRLCLRYYWDAS